MTVKPTINQHLASLLQLAEERLTGSDSSTNVQTDINNDGAADNVDITRLEDGSLKFAVQFGKQASKAAITFWELQSTTMSLFEQGSLELKQGRISQANASFKRFLNHMLLVDGNDLRNQVIEGKIAALEEDMEKNVRFSIAQLKESAGIQLAKTTSDLESFRQFIQEQSRGSLANNRSIMRKELGASFHDIEHKIIPTQKNVILILQSLLNKVTACLDMKTSLAFLKNIVTQGQLDGLVSNLGLQNRFSETQLTNIKQYLSTSTLTDDNQYNFANQHKHLDFIGQEIDQKHLNQIEQLELSALNDHELNQLAARLFTNDAESLNILKRIFKEQFKGEFNETPEIASWLYAFGRQTLADKRLVINLYQARKFESKNLDSKAQGYYISSLQDFFVSILSNAEALPYLASSHPEFYQKITAEFNALGENPSLSFAQYVFLKAPGSIVQNILSKVCKGFISATKPNWVDQSAFINSNRNFAHFLLVF